MEVPGNVIVGRRRTADYGETKRAIADVLAELGLLDADRMSPAMVDAKASRVLHALARRGWRVARVVE